MNTYIYTVFTTISFCSIQLLYLALSSNWNGFKYFIWLNSLLSILAYVRIFGQREILKIRKKKLLFSIFITFPVGALLRVVSKNKGLKVKSCSVGTNSASAIVFDQHSEMHIVYLTYSRELLKSETVADFELLLFKRRAYKGYLIHLGVIDPVLFDTYRGSSIEIFNKKSLKTLFSSKASLI